MFHIFYSFFPFRLKLQLQRKGKTSRRYQLPHSSNLSMVEIKSRNLHSLALRVTSGPL